MKSVAGRYGLYRSILHSDKFHTGYIHESFLPERPGDKQLILFRINVHELQRNAFPFQQVFQLLQLLGPEPELFVLEFTAVVIGPKHKPDGAALELKAHREVIGPMPADDRFVRLYREVFIYKPDADAHGVIGSEFDYKFHGVKLPLAVADGRYEL